MTSANSSAARRRWWALVGVVLLAAGAYAWMASGKRSDTTAVAAQTAPGVRPVPVVAEEARSGDIPVYLDGIGTVTPLATVTVKSRVDGQLMSVHFQEGDMVQAGDLLAEIDPRPFQVMLEQAKGQKARDEALLANARRDVDRYRKLLKEDSIPAQQLDTQEALVRQYEGVVQADQAAVDDATLQLTYARITAPISGRLGLRLVDPGNMIHASDNGGLVVITQMEPIGVVFTIPEDDLPQVLDQLHAGKTLAVEAYDRSQSHRLASGHLLTVDNAIDPNTGTLRLKAEFPNGDGALFPNQFVNARLELEVRHNAVLVPSAAIQRGADGAFVYVVKPDQTAEARKVRVDVNEGDDSSIADGLAAGELVVVDGAGGLHPGRPVRLQARDGATPTHGA